MMRRGRFASKRCVRNGPAVRRKGGSQLVESALIWPLVVLVAALFLSRGLEETALLRDARETHETERVSREFRMPEKALYWSSLLRFSGVSSSGSSE
ncbi:MAG: hypothetical protein IKX91_01715 [Firmicutes bacterium]|nr:hypothetical protein [Bacillota bacterium]